MWNKRPLAVTILAWVYILVGASGFVRNLTEIPAGNAFQFDNLLVDLLALLALIGGAFMLRGRNWARWLALAWIAFHVIVSAFHSLQEFAVHCLFCALIAWFLFRPEASRYFRGARIEPT